MYGELEELDHQRDRGADSDRSGMEHEAAELRGGAIFETDGNIPEVAPTRERATLVLEKGADHRIASVAMKLPNTAPSSPSRIGQKAGGRSVVDMLRA